MEIDIIILMWPNIIFFLEIILFALWIYLHLALYQEYLNIWNLNNLFVLAELFPTLDLLDWRIHYIYICVCVCVYWFLIFSQEDINLWYSLHIDQPQIFRTMEQNIRVTKKHIL